MIFVENDKCDGVILTMELQKGVLMRFQPGETIKAFILRVLDINDSVMEKEIQTLILNNGCVDEPETKKLVSGDTLVLSGAMPGLVGAMLRSNSPIKAMRQTLGSGGVGGDETIPEGLIRLKLFNSVLADYKETILNLGFYSEGETDEN